MDIAPLRGVRYAPGPGGARDLSRYGAVTAPPYDVISPEEHRRLLAQSPSGIVRLTLGERPGEVEPYETRASRLRSWLDDGILVRDDAPTLYVYEVDYPVPGRQDRVRLLALTALLRLEGFGERSVHPHERTFPKVVDDRLGLLRATGANLESIFLLYSDSRGEIDSILDEHAREPLVRVEARPDEFHSLHRIDRDLAIRPEEDPVVRLTRLLRPLPAIIADGHHRYTTSLRYRDEDGARDGAGWRLVTLANLSSAGLSILATHRLVRLAGADPTEVLDGLSDRLESAGPDDWELIAETPQTHRALRFPDALRSERVGVGRTAYSLLHDVVIDQWLAEWSEGPPSVAYYKEGTGEREALAAGEGQILFRMRPVDRGEFRGVVEGGEVLPHKTTYFYPKLWSGLLLWPIEPVAPLSAEE